jgi:hypothetical protein
MNAERMSIECRAAAAAGAVGKGRRSWRTLFNGYFLV